MASQTVILPEGYKPSENESYMSPMQLEYFRQKLLEKKKEVEEEMELVMKDMQDTDWSGPDLNDRASAETDTLTATKVVSRGSKLLTKIDAALERIEKGEYGYCEDTGEPIGIKRLEARPMATLSIDAQERHERYEKSHIDEDDI